MNKCKSTLFAFLIILPYSCRERATSSLNVIPGTPASQGQFDSVVKMFGCSGVKIADKAFLTSASCVIDFETKKLIKGAGIGNFLAVGYGLDVTMNQKKSKIMNIKIHAEFDNFVKKSASEPLDVSELKEVIDLAIVEVNDVIAEITSAELSKDFLPRELAYAIVTGYGLSKDPSNQGQDSEPGSSGKDLFWNRFKIKNLDEKRFYADSRDFGQGTDIIKLLAADRGAPVFHEEGKAPFRKLIGLASASDLNKQSYFILLSHKTLTCLIDGLKNSAKATDQNYLVFCSEP